MALKGTISQLIDLHVTIPLSSFLAAFKAPERRDDHTLFMPGIIIMFVHGLCGTLK